MLRLLTISNFAIIGRLELELGPGLNVFTGETGAGKSIILDALNLLVGGRADTTWIRTGASQARVSGLFAPGGAAGDAVRHTLAEHGIEPEGDEVILAREINVEGRNVCRVNSQVVPTRTLAALGEHLVDIHGQGQHLSLFRVREHLDILDRYAGVLGQRARVAALVAELRNLRQERGDLQKRSRDAAQRLDLLTYQVQEIGAARLRPGEEEELTRERNVIAHAERLTSLTDQAHQALYGGGDAGRSASDLLAEALTCIAQMEKLDPSVRGARETLESAVYQVEDLARTLAGYRDSVELDPGRLETIEERLDLIFRLKRKYSGGIPEVLAFADRAALEMQDLGEGETRVAELGVLEAQLLDRIGQAAEALSAARNDAGARLAASVEDVLRELAMGATRVAVRLDQQPAEDGAPAKGGTARLAFDATGVDKVELMLAAGAEEALKPLVRVASGGEASRLMLAIKVVLSRADRVSTLVFDEIDSGVGGRLGAAVGQKLWDLARDHQVLCVTHLPQIASMADRHYRVAKASEGGRISVALEEMAGDARTAEIGAMLGSTRAAALQNAREILEETARWKKGRIQSLASPPANP